MKKALLLIGSIWSIWIYPDTPKITVVFVVDQLSMPSFQEVENNLEHGLKKLKDNGIWYDNAFHPQVGKRHRSVVTGVAPGVNNTLNSPTKSLEVEEAKVPHYSQLPHISTLFDEEGKHHKVRSFSYKSSAAQTFAGPNGTPYWLDKTVGKFISNKIAYFAPEPDWLHTFNKNHTLLNKRKNSWLLAHKDPKKYDYPSIRNYRYKSHKSLFDPSNLISKSKAPMSFFKQFLLTPNANEVLFDLCLESVEQDLKSDPSSQLLLWVNLTALDKVARRFGTGSKEAIDMMYHIDQQIESFMNSLSKAAQTDNILYVLLSDHGVMPVSDLLKQCYHQEPGTSIMMHDIKKLINRDIKQLFGVRHIVTAIPAPYIYLNQEKLAKFSPPVQYNILTRIKSILDSLPGVKKVYSLDDLCLQAWKFGSTKWLFNNQLYPRRTGHFALEVENGILLTNKTREMKPKTFDYNIPVPIAFYHPHASNSRVIHDKVWTPQLTRTLCNILKLNPPSDHAMPIFVSH